ncbi:MAG: mercury resistance protein [Candidatus Tectomicrobia bacterium]
MQWKPYLSVGVALLTCPCHVPILVGALSGTVLGGWLSQYTLIVTLGMAGMYSCHAVQLESVRL